MILMQSLKYVFLLYHLYREIIMLKLLIVEDEEIICETLAAPHRLVLARN